MNWPQQWWALIAHYEAPTRIEVRAQFAAFCDARPVGAKFAHSATDGRAGASQSMKRVNRRWLICCTPVCRCCRAPVCICRAFIWGGGGSSVSLGWDGELDALKTGRSALARVNDCCQCGPRAGCFGRKQPLVADSNASVPIWIGFGSVVGRR